MVDISMITGMIGSLRAATDIASGLISLRDEAVLRSKVIELQTLILGAQSSAIAAQSALMEDADKIRGLEERISELECWQVEASRYELREYGRETFAYAIRDECRNGEPSHRLCPTCFQSRRKSILQFQHRSAEQQDIYECLPCKKTFFFGQRIEAPYERILRERDLF